MKVVIKNFFRNEMANLTLKSVRHFMPEAECHVLSLFKQDASEYDGEEELDVPLDNQWVHQTKYHSMGPSLGNKMNNLFFSEPYNSIAHIFGNYDGKVLMLAEDHFFTTGATLRELHEKDFDIAYAPWNGYDGFQIVSPGANGSILCVNPKKTAHLFPIPEDKTSVEHVLRPWVEKVDKSRLHVLTTRYGIDYKGDGFYSNSADEIRAALKKANIL